MSPPTAVWLTMLAVLIIGLLGWWFFRPNSGGPELGIRPHAGNNHYENVI